jgi:chromosome segregation ATPase
VAVGAEQVAPWVAVVTAMTGIAYQGYNTFKGRKKEKAELAEALDKAPLVKEQLELGNTRGAVEVLNAIIESQLSFMTHQDQRVKALEAESKGWQKRAEEASDRADTAEATARKLAQKVTLLERQVKRCEDHLNLLDGGGETNVD